MKYLHQLWGCVLNNRLVRAVFRPPYRMLKAPLAARKLASARAKLANHPVPYRVHVGCGTVYLEGWVNIDCRTNVDRVDLIWDISQSIPLPSDSCEVVFSEHVLEHLSVAQGLQFLRESRRVLIPGGVVRIAMPSLDDLIENTGNGQWRNQCWLSDPGCTEIATRAEMFNAMFRWWGHQWLYDREELHRRLKEAGFQTIVDVEWGRSSVPALSGLETRENSLLICEAVKQQQ